MVDEEQKRTRGDLEESQLEFQGNGKKHGSSILAQVLEVKSLKKKLKKNLDVNAAVISALK